VALTKQCQGKHRHELTLAFAVLQDAADQCLTRVMGTGQVARALETLKRHDPDIENLAMEFWIALHNSNLSERDQRAKNALAEMRAWFDD